MKHLKRRLVPFFLVFGLAITLSLGFAPRASAAAAICIQNSQDRPNARISCDANKAILKNAGISSVAADTCYYLNYPDPDSTSGTFPTVSQAPIGSDQCNDWLKDVQATDDGGATCFKIAGANVNAGTYSQGNVPSDIATKVSCSDSLLKQQPSGGGKVTTFRPGTCYLIFADHTIIQDSCENVLKEMAAANGTDNIESDPDGGGGPTGPSNPELSPSKQQAEIQKNCKAGLENCIQTNPLIKDVNAAINLMSALVGVIVVIMIIVGGIQYMTAGGNPQAVSAAKKRILNAVISIVALIFMYSLLQWLIPGGIF